VEVTSLDEEGRVDNFDNDGVVGIIVSTGLAEYISEASNDIVGLAVGTRRSTKNDAWIVGDDVLTTIIISSVSPPPSPPPLLSPCDILSSDAAA